MKQELRRLYGDAYDPAAHKAYFEPWNGRQQHEFLMLRSEHVMEQDASAIEFANTLEGKQAYLREIAAKLAEQYVPDLNIQTLYAGKLFYRALEGYVRFNYAYGNEVALFYEPSPVDAANGTFLDQLRQQLHAAGIE